MKAYSLQRLFAVVIDIIILSMLLYFVNAIIPYNTSYETAKKDNLDLSEKFLNKEITDKEYINQFFDNQYMMSKNSILQEAVGIIVYVAYFVTYQLFNNGQTLGKKMMKIRIKKRDNSELENADLIKREFLIHGMAISILLIVLLLVTGKSMFVYYYYPCIILNFLIIVISAFMILFRKDGRGLHDLIANTQVVMVNDVKEEVTEAEIIKEERSDKDERISRTRSSQTRKSKRDSK